jgi:hypothetical protein
MKRLTVQLRDEVHQALHVMADRNYREIKQQAAYLIDRGLNVTSDWTTTPPIIPGWYWAFDGEVIRVVFVVGEGVHGPQVEAPPFKMESYSHWLGPLPVPESPKA